MEAATFIEGEVISDAPFFFMDLDVRPLSSGPWLRSVVTFRSMDSRGLTGTISGLDVRF
jgi:hypothetical protein